MRARRRLLLLVLATAFLAVAGLVGWNAVRFARTERAQPPVGAFVEAAGLRLHYIERGQGPPIVLLHGNPGSAGDFGPLAGVLARDRRVIAFDRPGHGYSERGPASGTGPSVQVEAIRQALKSLGVERPVLVGHSWGGALALAYALRHPADVRALVLIGTRAFRFDGPGDPLYRALRAPVLGGALRWTVLPVFGTGVVESGLRAAFAPDSAPESYVRASAALWLRPGQAAATVWDTETLQRELPSLQERYAGIGVPVVILVGSEDGMEPESVGLARAIGHADLRVVPDAGHMLPWTHPDLVADAVRRVEASLAGERAS